VDPGALVLLGLGWMVVNAIRKSAGGPPTAGRTPGRTPPRPLPPDTGADPTQLEGQRLEELLRHLGRTLDRTAGPAGRPPDRRLPPAAEVEERESLETTPRVRSLETEPDRPARAPVDQDDEAEQVAARRIAAAEARSAPLTEADHRRFDQRIRQEPADKTATRALTARQLRDAVVWREVLGPPVSLREDEQR
jgi:hypothetical protein